MDITELTTALPNIRTRFLIISDTHRVEFSPEDKPLKRTDVAIHCGDLTGGSTLDEFRTAIKLLKDIDAPLKLVIAGNHDFTMDIPAFEEKVAEAPPPLAPDLVVREYGAHGEARQMFEEIKDAGFVFLGEGNHRLILNNDALLTIYASPWIPASGAWGFQYHPERGHDFSMEKGVDVVVTHGSPKGILDYTYGREGAGCPNLFAAVARSRPQLHCFGHIHEGWGPKLVTWRHNTSASPIHFTDIDNERSFLVEKLAGLQESRFDTVEALAAKMKKMDNTLMKGVTLFVNASIAGTNNVPTQKPWLIDIELPRAG